jgi:hypothetical protein
VARSASALPVWHRSATRSLLVSRARSGYRAVFEVVQGELGVLFGVGGGCFVALVVA